MSAPQWCFNRFRLDPASACLWRDAEPVPLPPKAFDVLHYLVTHPDRLVTKDELLDTVWPETAVSDAVVRVAIGALRQALGDRAPTPQYIATVLRRGYRFLAPVTVCTPSESTTALPSPTRPSPAPPLLVEREAVLQHLHAAWQQARQGVRQVVLVTGEAGMGKTAVVETLAAQVRTDPTAGLAIGQCVEHYGTGEAYLPILEVLSGLCQGPRGADLVALLRQHTPTWLVQMPWLLTAADREPLQYELQGGTRERMLREFAAVVEALTAVTPLLLVLEDLHWSDYATVDLLAMLARRRLPARLLVVGTYRPVKALVHHQPLRTVMQDLRRRDSMTEIPLAGLSVAAIESYLAARFPVRQFPAALARWLQQRTDGNPLFLVALLQALVAQGVLHAHDGCWTVRAALDALSISVPDSLWQLFAQQIKRLPLETQRVLEVASAAGLEFVTTAVAAVLECSADIVEEHCETLATEQLLRLLGVSTLPDGMMATRYTFWHALYQQGVYEQLGAGRRLRLHQRLGAYLERAYGLRAGEIAAELAEHFGRGQDTRRAVHYLHRAAENAARRYAHHEVIELATRALALLQQLPEAPARAQHEIDLHIALGPALIAVRGHTAPEVRQTYARAGALCHQVRESPQLPQTLVGLMMFHTGQGEHQTAQELGVRLLALAQRLHDPVVRMTAHGSLGLMALYLGDLMGGRGHLEQGVALCDYLTDKTLTLQSLFDWGVVCRVGVAWALQATGLSGPSLPAK